MGKSRRRCKSLSRHYQVGSERNRMVSEFLNAIIAFSSETGYVALLAAIRCIITESKRPLPHPLWKKTAAVVALSDIKQFFGDLGLGEDLDKIMFEITQLQGCDGGLISRLQTAANAWAAQYMGS